MKFAAGKETTKCFILFVLFLHMALLGFSSNVVQLQVNHKLIYASQQSYLVASYNL